MSQASADVEPCPDDLLALSMHTHVCPSCGRSHKVRAVRTEFAYGRQLTCSPDCESVRRKWMRHRPV